MCMEPYQNCTTYCSETALSNVIILWVHNHYRSHIALGQLANFPPAANMFQLRWDDDLAAVAGARGRDCVRSAGQFTDYFEQQWTADFPLVDQNLLIHCSNQMTPAVAAPTSRKTKLAVTRMREVPALAPESKVFLYVCNYRPQGSEVDEPLYQAGPPCSLCPEDTACESSAGLCVLQRDNPGVDTTSSPPVLIHPPEARDSAPVAVAIAVAPALAPALAAALVAVHRWHHGVA
ncbi:cysteine-rich venom protein [Dermacentor silvarum]|uniref:cysteine-rich venom protein n=1 Tax=Dermacentor silvarum TaxID=543639 RepID=UPI0018995C52|nr:cysteine-rich venom protein [Dermacentor silvarum]